MYTHVMLRSVLILIAMVAVLGLIDASYLYLTSYYGESPVCNFTKGCDVVAASPYSKVLGIPLSLLGAFFYIVNIGFALWALTLKDMSARYWLLGIASIGAISSVYFLFLQAFVIHAWCEYCLFSALATFIIFGLSVYYFRKKPSSTSNSVEVQ